MNSTHTSFIGTAYMPAGTRNRYRRATSIERVAVRVSILLLALFATPLWAQSAADGFDPDADGAVRSIVVQPDGKTLIGGDFTHVGGQTRNHVARLNADGTLDAGFDPGADGPVRCVALQPDGKVLVGGDFVHIGGQSRSRIVRLDADGTLDAGFNPATNDAVISVAVQPDGKVLIAGAFTQADGLARNRIARLEADGTLDAGFNPAVDNMVLSLALQPDGKVLIGGTFTQIGAQARNHIARLNADGTLDTGFDPAVDSWINSLALQPDGKVLIGGNFGQVGGQPRSDIARINADGTLDTGFDPFADNAVYALVVQPDGRILVGGAFTQISGQARSRIAWLNMDGTVDAGADADPVADDAVYGLAVQPDGKVLAGGAFTQIGGQARNCIARFNTDGTLDADFDPGINGSSLSSLAVQPDGKVLFGGHFTQIGGQARQYLARLNADGTLDADFNPAVSGWVNSIGVRADGRILIGGIFNQIAGQVRYRVAWLEADGTLAAGFTPPIISVDVIAAAQLDGKVLISGDFEDIGGQPRYGIARLNANGTLDAGFNLGADGRAYSITVQSDGKVLLGGEFTQILGQPRSGIVRLNADGTLDPGFDPGSNGGTYRAVYGLAVQPDGKLLVGGDFTQFGGQPRNNIARLNMDGSLDPGFDPDANNALASIVVQPDGKVLVGGSFTQIHGQARNRIARLNADGTLDAAFDPASNNGVGAIAVQADGKVLVGGEFTQIGGQARNHFARLASPEAALQSLDVGPDHASVHWSRGGSGPELYGVGFERSDDGATWVPLGAATHVDGAWSLDGLDLPRNRNVWLRARGVASGGLGNVSFSLIESVRLTYPGQYAVTASVQAGQGDVTPSTQLIEAGQDVMFNVMPATAWHVVAMIGDTCTPVDQGGDIWTAANIQAACTVAATFGPNPPTAMAQGVNVPFNTSQAVTLTGNDPNAGGPSPFTYALVTQPAHGTISGFDAGTGALTYTPLLGYFGADDFTFTVTTVNGTSLPATVGLDVMEPHFALLIDDGHEFARYGQVVHYVATLTNTGGLSSEVPVAFTLSGGFDAEHASLTCFGAGGGASCVQDASDPLRFTITLPAARSLTWMVTVPVRSDTQDASVDLGVTATGATPAVDTNTLVIFHDGFDVPGGDGTQSLPLIDAEGMKADFGSEAGPVRADPAAGRSAAGKRRHGRRSAGRPAVVRPATCWLRSA